MNPEIDLVFFDGCPHVDAAREALGQGLDLAGHPREWREWLSDDPALPDYAAGFGSPSIFVAHREMTGASPGPTPRACRVFRDRHGGLRSAPEPAEVARAVRKARP